MAGKGQTVCEGSEEGIFGSNGTLGTKHSLMDKPVIDQVG